MPTDGTLTINLIDDDIIQNFMMVKPEHQKDLSIENVKFLMSL